MTEEALVKDIQKRVGTLKSGRANFENHWQEIADYIIPFRSGFTRTISAGQKNHQFILEGTGPWALEQLANGVDGMLTNPSTIWCKLVTENQSLMDDGDVVEWLDRCTRIMMEAFSSPETNFYAQLHEIYTDLAAFGTAVLQMESTPGEGVGVRFYARHLSECLIEENRYGIVDTLYRSFKYSARQIHQQWGKKDGQAIEIKRENESLLKSVLGEKVTQALLDDKMDMEFDIIHEVRPRTERNTQKADVKNKPWSSIYILKNQKVLNESGFDRFPYLVPRWYKMTGEKYGRSPAMTALSDVKTLNEMVRTTLKSGQKIVDPPLMVPDDGFLLPIKTTPNSLIFYRSGQSQYDRIVPLQTGGRVDIGLELENARREQISRAFYLDRLRLQKDKVEMTRAEAMIRDQENLRQMSPIVSRLEVEMLNPVVQNTFSDFQDQGKFPEPPRVLKDAKLKVIYTSTLARAQRSGDAAAMQAVMSLNEPLVAMDAGVMDNFDKDYIARQSVEWFGAPNKCLVPIAQRNANREARAKQQAALQQQQMEMNAAKAAKDNAAAQPAGAMG
jgi:hypothetical protein